MCYVVINKWPLVPPALPKAPIYGFPPLFGTGRGGSVLCISILNYLISSLGLSNLERGEGRRQGCRLERVEKLYTEHRIVFNLFWLSTSSSILWRHSGGDHQLPSVTGSSKSQWMIMSRNVNYKCIFSKKASSEFVSILMRSHFFDSRVSFASHSTD